MTTPDIAVLHRRYVDLASRFKSAWTFHQFLQGIQKFFTEVEIGRYPSDFQDIHGTLKGIADNLNGGDGDRLALQLDQVERQLAQMTGILSATDSRVSASLLRQFFDRVKNFDEQILAQMVRFYLANSSDSSLGGERQDKLDFLVSKLSEELDRVTGLYVLRDRTRLRELFEGFWGALPDVEIEAGMLASRRAQIEELRRELGGLQSFESLTGSGFIQRYRDLKHEMGRYLFHPELMVAVVEANLAVKNKVRQYYRSEEQRILDESNRILELESEVGSDPPLAAEISDLRQSMEHLERSQQRDNVKLGDLDLLRRQVGELAPRLAARREQRGPRDGLGGPPGSAEHQLSAEVEDAAAQARGMAAPHLQEILEALDSTDGKDDPKSVALSRDVYHLRLEPREVIAYRRIYVSRAGGAEIETFLLEAAALRLRINQEAAEIAELLDETAVTKDAPVFERARATTRSADAFVQRFSSVIDVAVQDGNFIEAQQLQLLRMRLIRDYSGLWLLVNRPSST
ncbi:MAG: hypothetical protein ABIV06_04480 [Thermoanaerobaculia bacterium]